MTLASTHTAALYDAQLLPADDVVHDFVAHKDVLAALLDDLRSRRDTVPQPHLILGGAGMGKSHLLRRVAVELERDAALAADYRPVSLPEDVYAIHHLGDLWVTALDALSQGLARAGHIADAARIHAALDDFRGKASRNQEVRLRAVLLDEARRAGRKLVLLVDNLHVVLARIGTADWALRDALQDSPSLVLIGTSPAPIASTYLYDHAFYDFFAVHSLAGLTVDEMGELLVALAHRRRVPEVQRMVTEHPERVRPFRVFADGSPRIATLLCDLMALSPDADLATLLQLLLDRHTPVYRARMETLAPQAQLVVHALARVWDPALASEVAGVSGLDVNAVSAQLGRLTDEGVVEKVSSYDRAGLPRRKTAFQLTDRLMQLWHVLRRGPAGRQEVAALAALATRVERAAAHSDGTPWLAHDSAPAWPHADSDRLARAADEVRAAGTPAALLALAPEVRPYVAALAGVALTPPAPSPARAPASRPPAR